MGNDIGILLKSLSTQSNSLSRGTARLFLAYLTNSLPNHISFLFSFCKWIRTYSCKVLELDQMWGERTPQFPEVRQKMFPSSKKKNVFIPRKLKIWPFDFRVTWDFILYLSLCYSMILQNAFMMQEFADILEITLESEEISEESYWMET